MKKLLVSIVALAIAATAFAGRPTGLTLGGGYAMNFYNTTFTGTYSDATNNETSSFGGVFAEVGYNLGFSQLSSLYFGLRYSATFRGDFEGFEGNSSEYSVSLTEHDYLALPVKFMMAFGGRTKFFFDAGPTFSLWTVNASAATSGSSSSQSSVTGRINHFANDNGAFNRFNVALGGSAGVLISSHVKIYAAFDANLLKSYQNPKSYVGSSYKGFRNELRIGAAYVF